MPWGAAEDTGSPLLCRALGTPGSKQPEGGSGCHRVWLIGRNSILGRQGFLQTAARATIGKNRGLTPSLSLKSLGDGRRSRPWVLLPCGCHQFTPAPCPSLVTHGENAGVSH